MIRIAPIIVWLGICLVASAGEDPVQNTPKGKQTALPDVSQKTRKDNPADLAKESNLTAGDQKLLDWFDTLGFPDLSKAQFGQVAGRRYFHVEGQDSNAEVGFGFGFLLQEDKTSFTVFGIDLSTTTYRRTGGENDSIKQARFEIWNLEQGAAKLVKQLAAPPDNSKDFLPRWFGRRTPERVEVLLVARACAAKGSTALAHQLLHYVATMADPRNDEIPAAESLPRKLAEEIAETIIWQNIEALGDPDIGRAELLKRFRHFSKAFRQTTYGNEAKEIESVLNRMVKEDAEHHRPPALDKLNNNDRIAELIFRLRDERGNQDTNPGRCAFYFEYRWPFSFVADSGEELRAGTQLIEFGFDAVPQLIAHLDDTRLTRAIGFHRSFYFSHYPLRVGDCVRAILEQIAVQEFYSPRTTSSEMIKDGEVAKVRAAVEAWWAVVQMKGEKQFLIEGVLKHDRRTSDVARRLLIKFPDSVLDTVAAATREPPEEPWTYHELIQIAAKVPGDKVTQFLLDKLTSKEDLSVRVVAAEELLKRKHPQAVSVLINEWQLLLRAAIQDRAAKSLLKGDSCGRLVRFLIASRNAEATRAVTAGLDQLEVDARLAVVYSFALRKNFPTLKPARGLWMHFADDNPVLGDDLLTAAEDLLVKSLDDRAESTEITGTWNGKPIKSIRIGEIAALILADRWKADYKFDLAAPVPLRNRQLAEMKNVWHKKHHLPLLPIPE